MISICTPLKNRTSVDTEHGNLRLFPNCVEKATKDLKLLGIPFEWVVADFNSEDADPRTWIGVYCANYQVITVNGFFNRGKGLNEAAKVATYEKLCFLDADMLTCPDFWTNGIENLEKNIASFPICWASKDHTNTIGFFHTSAYGNCFVTKKMHNVVGGVPEYKQWSLEDTHFYQSVRKLFQVERKKCPNLLHQYHPDSFEWKNQYYEK